MVILRDYVYTSGWYGYITYICGVAVVSLRKYEGLVRLYYVNMRGWYGYITYIRVVGMVILH